ncbi:MAG: internal scaffolding protein [Microviridae sp.]|nr:MAG: internal scaffolding protein [Microviridae sp.]
MRKHSFQHSEKPSKVQQQFKESSDINNIMDRAKRTRQIPSLNRSPIFGNIPSLDFMTAQNMIIDARNSFEALPAKVRREFQNDPYQLVRAFEIPEMLPKLIELGLVEKPVVEPVKADPEANPHKKAPVEGA